MSRSIVPTTALLFLTSVAWLCSCSSWPDFDALTAEGEANNAPIIIFGERWAPPYHNGGDLKIGFINLQNTGITTIRLFVAQCGAKGAVYSAGHVLLSGPFNSRQAFIAVGSWSEDPDHYFPASGGVSGIRLITKIEIDEADGSKIEYKGKDVMPLLDKRLENFCPAFTGY